MTDGRGLDPLRLAEAAVEAIAVLGVTALPAAWNVFDSSLAVVMAAMVAGLTLASTRYTQ